MSPPRWSAQGVGLQTDTDLVDAGALPDGGGFAATDTRGARREFAAVLFATGRRPNTEGLGLDAAGVKLTAGGAVVVDGVVADQRPVDLRRWRRDRPAAT
jgi:glutathione reductase (NADPH)